MTCCFSVADAPSQSMVQALAHLSGCSEDKIRHCLSQRTEAFKLYRSKVCKRPQSPTAGVEGALLGTAKAAKSGRQVAAAAVPVAAGFSVMSPEQQLMQVQALRGQGKGGSGNGSLSPESAVDLLKLLPCAPPYDVREAVADAILSATSPAALAKLSNSMKLLDCLDAWLVAAEADQHYTLMDRLLRSLQHLPCKRKLVLASSLPKTIGRLQRHPLALISRRALESVKQIGQSWAAATGAGQPSSSVAGARKDRASAAASTPPLSRGVRLAGKGLERQASRGGGPVDPLLRQTPLPLPLLLR